MVVSRETVQQRVNCFGGHFAGSIKRDRPVAVRKWPLDEVVISISGRKYRLGAAVDANGDVLDVLVQPQRNGGAPGAARQG